MDAFAARNGMERRHEYDEILRGLSSPDKWPTVGEHINRDGIYLMETPERGYLREGSFVDMEHQDKLNQRKRDHAAAAEHPGIPRADILDLITHTRHLIGRFPEPEGATPPSTPPPRAADPTVCCHP